MIGQQSLLNYFRILIENDKLPRFIILCGDKYSGRHCLVKEVAKMLQAYLIPCELGIDSVREAIDNCYKCAGNTIYFFADADKMSVAAKNSLLKITEEPPRQAYFILSVYNEENMLETLRSRAVTIHMFGYTEGEVLQIIPESERSEVLDILPICNTPGMLQAMKTVGKDLLNFATSIVENIREVSFVNALMIPTHLKFKDGQEGFEPEMVMKAVAHIAFTKMKEVSIQELRVFFARMVLLTHKYIKEISVSSLKKDSIVDAWIMDMRELL